MRSDLFLAKADFCPWKQAYSSHCTTQIVKGPYFRRGSIRRRYSQVAKVFEPVVTSHDPVNNPPPAFSAVTSVVRRALRIHFGLWICRITAICRCPGENQRGVWILSNPTILRRLPTGPLNRQGEGHDRNILPGPIPRTLAHPYGQ